MMMPTRPMGVMMLFVVPDDRRDGGVFSHEDVRVLDHPGDS